MVVSIVPAIMRHNESSLPVERQVCEANPGDDLRKFFEHIAA